jgi:hypothetical protein
VWQRPRATKGAFITLVIPEVFDGAFETQPASGVVVKRKYLGVTRAAFNFRVDGSWGYSNGVLLRPRATETAEQARAGQQNEKFGMNHFVFLLNEFGPLAESGLFFSRSSKIKLDMGSASERVDS